MQRKAQIFVVISVLAGILSYPGFEAFAVPPDPNWGSGDCTANDADPVPTRVLCCWDEPDILNPGETIKWCQGCDITPTGQPTDCGPIFSQRPQPTGPFAPPQDGVLEQPPIPPPGPFVPPQGGVLQQQPSEGGGSQPLTRGQGILPQDGGLQQPPTDQGATEPSTTERTQPATDEEEQPVPVCQEGLEFNEDLGFCVPTECPEGQVLDEESGICVLAEPETEEEPAQPEPEEEQPSEESDSGDDNNN